MYLDVSTCYDWPVKKTIVDSEFISGNSLSPLGARNKNFGAASQTLLTGVK